MIISEIWRIFFFIFNFSFVFTQYTLTNFITEGSEWRYSDLGKDTGEYYKIDYNDSTDDWKTGFAKFGFGDDNEVTTINNRPNGSNIVTSYYRTKFTSNNDYPDIADLQFGVIRDDGIVVYLNENEIWRDNIAESLDKDSLNYFIIASARAPNEAEFQPGIFINPTFWRKGENILVAEVHQYSPDSSDMAFDMWLSANISDIPLPFPTSTTSEQTTTDTSQIITTTQDSEKTSQITSPILTTEQETDKSESSSKNTAETTSKSKTGETDNVIVDDSKNDTESGLEGWQIALIIIGIIIFIIIIPILIYLLLRVVYTRT